MTIQPTLRIPVLQSPGRALVTTWLVTAAWDFTCASLLGVLAYHSTFSRFWQGVASVVFGPSTFESGSKGVALGLLLHLSVALTWSALFILLLRGSDRLRQIVSRTSGALAVAAVYGPIIWLTMSLVVIQMATGKMPTFGFRWWVQVFAHIPFVTIPLVFTARRFLANDADGAENS